MTTPDNPASPCIRQCRLDESGRYCTGCLRTLSEIGGWSTATPAQKQAALARIAALTQPQTERALHCSQCGQAFLCGRGGRHGGCWCADLPPLRPAHGTNSDCLCPDCLSHLANA